MSGRSAVIARPCECGALAARHVNQFIHRDELWWDSEFRCQSCGTAICEHAGPGPAPDDVREALLAAHGPVRLRLEGSGHGLVAVLKVLREIWALPLPQARALADELRCAARPPGRTGPQRSS